MQKKNSLFQLGAMISMGVLLLWKLLSFFGQFRLTSMAFSGVTMDLSFLLQNALPIIPVVIFLCSCFVRQKKVLVTIGAAVLFLVLADSIYLDYQQIVYWKARSSLTNSDTNPMIRQYIMYILSNVAYVGFAALAVVVVFCKNGGGSLKKLLCFLPVVSLAFASFALLSDWIDGSHRIGYNILFFHVSLIDTRFPFWPLVSDMLELVAFVFYAGYLTRDEEERTTTGGVILGVVGLGVFAFANVGCALIAMVSKALYGRVYYFDGYDLTKALWVLVFVLLVGGAVMMPFYVALTRKNVPGVPRYNPQPMQQPVYQQPVQQPVYQQPVQQPVYRQPVHQPTQQDAFEQINQLKQMLDMGLITQQDFETKKRQILGL